MVWNCHLMKQRIFFDTTPSNKALLNNYYNKLNEKGRNKALEQLEMLTKIPEYKKNKRPLLRMVKAFT